MDYHVIFDNRAVGDARLSVLIPVRDDNKLFMLLDVLAHQSRAGVEICIANDLQPRPFVDALPHPLTGVIYHATKHCSIACKINHLLTTARGEWIVVIESDTIPDARWMDDLLSLISLSDPACVHLGGEIYAKPFNLNNVFFRRQAGLPRHEEATFFANDTAWLMACERQGFPVVRHDREALLYHDTARPDCMNMRFLYYAHDFAFIAAQQQDGAFFYRKLLAELYYLARGVVNVPVFILIYCFYRLKQLALSLL